MSAFYQTGVIATFHRLSANERESIELKLERYTVEHPIALVLPSLYSELQGQALQNIVNELKKYDDALYKKPRWLVLNKLDMVPNDERAELIKDFVKRFKFKGRVFEISALTREGCEPLIKEIYKHIKAEQIAEVPHVDVDPRFIETPKE